MTRMCGTNWKCILSSRAGGAGWGCWPIVTQGMALGTKGSAQVGVKLHQEAATVGGDGFRVGTLSRKHTGLRWGKGFSISSSSSSPSSKPQQVPHPDWISASEHPFLPPSLPRLEMTKQSGLSEQKTKFAPGQLHSSPEPASATLSPRQRHFQ